MLWISSLFVFAAALCAIAAIASAVAPSRLQQRLAALAIDDIDDGTDRDTLLEGSGRGFARFSERFFGSRKRRVSLEDDPMRVRLMRAGYRKPSAVPQYIGVRVVLVIALPLLAWLSPISSAVPARFEMFVPLVALVIGYVGPSYWLDRRTRRRQEEIDRHLPAALDLMVVCVESGLGLIQSIYRVGREMAQTSPVLSEELGLVAIESRTGRSNAAALKNLATRTGVREVSVLVAMLMQTERFGTSLADSLRVHCDMMRTQRLQRAEADAARAPLKMLFPTSLILVALLLLIIGLAAIQASQTLGA